MIILAYIGTMLILFSEDMPIFLIHIFMWTIGCILLGIAQLHYDDLKCRVKKLEKKEGSDNAR